MGVNGRHVHNISNVGSILELVVTQSKREEIVKAITQMPEGFRADQCLRVNDSFDAILDSAALGVDCDHPSLHLRFSLEPPSDSAELATDDGLSRIHLGRLHKPGAWQRLQDVYGALCPDVDHCLGLAEQAVRSEHLTAAERQGDIDAADALLHEAVLAAGFGTLGHYEVKVARARKDWTRARLEQSTSRFDAERLWRKGLRGKDRPMVASEAAKAEGRTVKEEATSFWSSAWGSAEAGPQQLSDG
ncbi:unnamed protein product [Tilletia controversa]|nr:unnamed protein product [Tilletia controversa]